MIIDCISDKKSSKSNCVVQFLELVEKIKPDSKGCKNWPLGISKTGYGVYSINNFTYSVPRLIYNTLRNGYTRDGLVVRHKCDNRACCNINHLEIGTQSENLIDASNRKRLKFGEENNKTFLSVSQILEIRNSYPEKSTVELGKIYKMAASNIREIIIGKSWTQIPGSKKLIRYKRAIGEKMGRSKLTEKNVLEIREKYPKFTKAHLAREYGVGHAMICCIVNRKNWTHI